MTAAARMPPEKRNGPQDLSVWAVTQNQGALGGALGAWLCPEYTPAWCRIATSELQERSGLMATDSQDKNDLGAQAAHFGKRPPADRREHSAPLALLIARHTWETGVQAMRRRVGDRSDTVGHVTGGAAQGLLEDGHLPRPLVLGACWACLQSTGSSAGGVLDDLREYARRELPADWRDGFLRKVGALRSCHNGWDVLPMVAATLIKATVPMPDMIRVSPAAYLGKLAREHLGDVGQPDLKHVPDDCRDLFTLSKISRLQNVANEAGQDRAKDATGKTRGERILGILWELDRGVIEGRTRRRVPLGYVPTSPRQKALNAIKAFNGSAPPTGFPRLSRDLAGPSGALTRLYQRDFQLLRDFGLIDDQGPEPVSKPRSRRAKGGSQPRRRMIVPAWPAGVAGIEAFRKLAEHLAEESGLEMPAVMPYVTDADDTDSDQAWAMPEHAEASLPPMPGRVMASSLPLDFYAEIAAEAEGQEPEPLELRHEPPPAPGDAGREAEKQEPVPMPSPTQRPIWPPPGARGPTSIASVIAQLRIERANEVGEKATKEDAQAAGA